VAPGLVLIATDEELVHQPALLQRALNCDRRIRKTRNLIPNTDQSARVTMLATLGAAGIGLVWGWLVVQVMSSRWPSPWGVAGMGTATATLLFTLFVALAGHGVVIGAAAMLVAALGHLVLVGSLRRKTQKVRARRVAEGDLE